MSATAPASHASALRALACRSAARQLPTKGSARTAMRTASYGIAVRDLLAKRAPDGYGVQDMIDLQLPRQACLQGAGAPERERAYQRNFSWWSTEESVLKLFKFRPWRRRTQPVRQCRADHPNS